MGLKELKERRLLLPEEHWGREPSPSGTAEVLILLAAALGVASTLFVWFGRGGALTFAGLGLFLIDLVLFLYLTFRTVENQFRKLLDLGVAGEVDGIDRDLDPRQGNGPRNPS